MSDKTIPDEEEETVCPECSGRGWLPEGCCTPDGPEWWSPCACNKEQQEYMDKLMDVRW